jgi:phosphoribosyl-ATP pyrophosphohydrolase
MPDPFREFYDDILAQKKLDPEYSRTAKLFKDGRKKIVKKLGEEIVEIAIDAVADDRDAIVAESADVLYHLMVLWVDAQIRPGDIWAEVDRRKKGGTVAAKKPK